MQDQTSAASLPRLLLPILLALSSSLACGIPGPRHYAISEVQIVKAERNAAGEMRIDFITIVENLWVCPRPKVTVGQDRIDVLILRSSDPQEHFQFVEFDNPDALPVFLVDRDGNETEIWK